MSLFIISWVNHCPFVTVCYFDCFLFYRKLMCLWRYKWLPNFHSWNTIWWLWTWNILDKTLLPAYSRKKCILQLYSRSLSYFICCMVCCFSRPLFSLTFFCPCWSFWCSDLFFVINFPSVPSSKVNFHYGPSSK